MRLIPLALLLSMVFASCATKKTVVELPQVPIMSFTKEMLKVGILTEGDKVELRYRFTNSGNVDLLIDLVTACKCASLDWTQGPIPPGGKGVIDVVFDSTGFNGEVLKTIDIIANTDPIVKEIKFTARVNPRLSE